MKTRLLAVLLPLVAVLAIAQTQTPSAAPAAGAPDAEMFVGAPKGKPLTGKELDLRTYQVGGLLRCPVCQGLSVADSPSEMAVNMKHQVKALLARGFTEEQILDYFERSYGQFVLLKPKFQGVNTMVWILPVLALAIGVVIVVFKIRKLEQPPVAAASPSVTPAGEEDPYLAQVRELVRGGRK